MGTGRMFEEKSYLRGTSLDDHVCISLIDNKAGFAMKLIEISIHHTSFCPKYGNLLIYFNIVRK